MKRTLLVAYVLLCSFAYCQNVLTGKEIYSIGCKAVVQIKADDEIEVGFLISPNGRILLLITL